jgi:drug/metabolite transporter, DME family
VRASNGHYTAGVRPHDSSSPERSTLPRFWRDPLVFGTCCGLASALGYTAANACLTAVSGFDAVWVSCVKAFPTVALFGPLLLYRLAQRTEKIPARSQWITLVVASLFCQVLGNVVFQWTLGIIGMALTVPLTLGTMILGGALLGRVILHEAITVRMAISTVVLITAVFVLSLGAGEASQAMARSIPPPSIWVTITGVAAACLSGVAYAVLGVAIRYAVTDRISIVLTMVTVTLTGLVALGAISLIRIGISGMLLTPIGDFWTMMLAGIFNAAAFLALTKSLQLIPLFYVNALNATQATMAAVAGVLLFAEPSSGALWIGVALTAAGLVLMQRRTRAGARDPIPEPLSPGGLEPTPETRALLPAAIADTAQDTPRQPDPRNVDPPAVAPLTEPSNL